MILVCIKFVSLGMPFSQLTPALKKLGPFSNSDLDLFYERVLLRKVLKDEFLLREGETSQDFYFIQNGSFRQFSFEEDGSESTFKLYLKNDWMLEHKSFTGRRPTKQNIQATEDAEVYSISIEKIHELIQLSPNFFSLGRLLETIGSQFYHASKLSAEEKYQHLLTNEPRILQQFPLKYIASYLNLTPETLSRVRSKISN